MRHSFVLGEHGAPIKGKSTNRKVKWNVRKDAGLICKRKMQMLVKDVMHIDNHSFLVSVSSPLELTIVAYVKDVSKSTLGEGLQGKLDLLRFRGFD